MDFWKKLRGSAEPVSEEALRYARLAARWQRHALKGRVAREDSLELDLARAMDELRKERAQTEGLRQRLSEAEQRLELLHVRLNAKQEMIQRLQKLELGLEQLAKRPHGADIDGLLELVKGEQGEL